MFDEQFRSLLPRAMRLPVRALVRFGVAPDTLSFAGVALALVASLLIARNVQALGISLWILSRIVDALDGLVAREAQRTSSFGGFLDITLDMTAYTAMVLAFAHLHANAGLLFPAILAGYVLVATTTLALSSILERSAHQLPNNNRTLQFTPGFAEAGETSLVYVAFVVWPSGVTWVGWCWVAMCAATVVQRTLLARRLLSHRA